MHNATIPQSKWKFVYSVSPLCASKTPPTLAMGKSLASGPSKVSDSSVGYFHSLQQLQLEPILNHKGMRVLP